MIKLNLKKSYSNHTYSKTFLFLIYDFQLPTLLNIEYICDCKEWPCSSHLGHFRLQNDLEGLKPLWPSHLQKWLLVFYHRPVLVWMRKWIIKRSVEVIKKRSLKKCEPRTPIDSNMDIQVVNHLQNDYIVELGITLDKFDMDIHVASHLQVMLKLGSTPN